MSQDLKAIFAALAAPFPSTDIEWRAGSTNKAKTSALALAYITSRAVMNRLDEVVGPENWRDEYRSGPQGGVVCQLSLRLNGEWLAKEDGADNTDFEAVKGGLSDALKRAAVKWGIGRYLYQLPAKWVTCEQRGRSVVLTQTPALPEWALPQPQPKTVRKTKAKAPKKGKAATPAKAKAPKKAAAKATVQPVKSNGNPGNFVIPFGKTNKGKKLSEVSREALEYYASQMQPTTAPGKELQVKAQAYLEALQPA